MRRTLIISILVLCCAAANAQADRQHIRRGNRLYRQQQTEKMEAAEVNYRKALDANAKNPQALYDLGCALMMQEKDSAAIEQFEKAGEIETNKLRKAKSYHNIGVICQSHQMFKEAIEAYKESLRNNPKDDETRYNLALCQKQLKNQDDSQNQQQQDKEQEEQDNNQNQQQQQQQQEEQQDQMSRDNAEQLLQAAMRDEKEIQDKMQRQQQPLQNRNIDKNW